MATLINNFPSNYKTPTLKGTEYTLLNLKKPGVEVGMFTYDGLYSSSTTGAGGGQAIKVENSAGTFYYEIDENGDIVGNNKFTVEIGANTITYYFSLTEILSQAASKTTETSTFTIYGVENKLPLKPWTNGEVLERLVQVVEPLQSVVVEKEVTLGWRGGRTEEGDYVLSSTPFCDAFPVGYEIITEKYEHGSNDLYDLHLVFSLNNKPILRGSSKIKDTATVKVKIVYVAPRFKFVNEDSTKQKVFDELAPEYTFTRMNLRECLQLVGGRIHAEPRLKAINGRDCVTFDFFGEQAYATYKNHATGKIKRLSKYKYITNKGAFDLEQTCTRLESYIDNLVSRVNWQDSTVGQPYEGETAGQSLRTETYYLRAGEDSENFYLKTQYPIDRPVKMEAYANGEWRDITAYVYEKTVYNNLSSYARQSPAKAYALYYTQGEKGIKGFFFKPPSARGGTDVDYSLVNVIRSAGGGTVTDYINTKFRLSYVPIYSTRVTHGKQYVSDYLPLPRTLNYSQGENSVETRFFGQNIKSTAQRMGNIEKSVTFVLRNVNNIPKAGQLWDDTYYISSVSVAVGIDLFHVTVGLSKHFNRKSKYIGANSYRRIYEVSEKMVTQRHTVYSDYIVIKDYEEDRTNYEISGDFGMLLNQRGFGLSFHNMFLRNANSEDLQNAEVTSIYAYTTSKQGNPNNHVLLPVVSSAFGNVMEFTWEYEDNFSAGIRMDTSVIADKYIYGTGTEYADYYGRAYYLLFALLSRAQTDNLMTLETPISTATALPLVTNPLTSADDPSRIAGCMDTLNPLLLRKDSREALKGSYTIEFVADGKDFILGSGLTEKNPLISYAGRAPHLYVLPRRVNRFSETLTAEELESAMDLEEIDSGDVKIGRIYTRCKGRQSEVSGEAWVYAFPVENGTPYTVEDEDGNVSEITPTVGGEILIAKNVKISQGDTVGAFEAVAVHDIFKYKKWKRNKN